MSIDRLRRFIGDMTSLTGGAWQDKDEAAIVEVGARLLGGLVKYDDWLPEQAAKAPPHGYAQNLLWCDPFERFCVVSFVWGPGAATPVHDHEMWGLVGMLRGSETSLAFDRDPETGAITPGGTITAPDEGATYVGTPENSFVSGIVLADADIALSMSELVRSQILQQAGISVLAQANQAPSLILSLLK